MQRYKSIILCLWKLAYSKYFHVSFHHSIQCIYINQSVFIKFALPYQYKLSIKNLSQFSIRWDCNWPNRPQYIVTNVCFPMELTVYKSGKLVSILNVCISVTRLDVTLRIESKSSQTSPLQTCKATSQSYYVGGNWPILSIFV